MQSPTMQSPTRTSVAEQQAFAAGRAAGEADAALRVTELAEFLEPGDNEGMAEILYGIVAPGPPGSAAAAVKAAAARLAAADASFLPQPAAPGAAATARCMQLWYAGPLVHGPPRS